MIRVPSIILNNGVEMPQIGFGVFGMREKGCRKAVRLALESGYRLIDTAQHYCNEKDVGRALRESSLPREDVFITTKLWNEDHGHDNALKAFDTSLRTLGLDYVDLYLIHFPQPKRDLYLETWRALERVNREGRARAIGVSNFNVPHIQRLVNEGDVVPAVNQIEIHTALQQAHLHAFHQRFGIATEAASPLGRGHLRNARISSIAARYGRTPAQVVLRWHVERGVVAIPKSSAARRIQENLDVFNFDLQESDMLLIEQLERGRRFGHDPDDFETGAPNQRTAG